MDLKTLTEKFSNIAADDIDDGVPTNRVMGSLLLTAVRIGVASGVSLVNVLEAIKFIYPQAQNELETFKRMENAS